MIEGGSAADWVELPQDSVDLLRQISADLPEELIARGALRRSPQGGYLCHSTMFGSSFGSSFGSLAELTQDGMSARAMSTHAMSTHAMSAHAMTRIMHEVLGCVERVAALVATELAAISQTHDLSEAERLLDDVAPLATQLYVTVIEIALPELVRQELLAALRRDDA
jgi:hypothetical protein